MFAEIAKRIDSEAVKKTNAVFQWNITKDGKTFSWTTDLKNGNGSVYNSAAKDKADCTLSLSDDDFADLVQGKADAMKLFTGGKLRISGNIMLSQKLQVLFKAKAKL